jgi:L-rhamnose-H+ transport protein
MSENLTGIVLALLGGICVGNCMLPLRRIRVWPWECTWFIFSLVSLLLIPGLIATLVIPGWPGLYASLPHMAWLPSLLLGFGWGIAQVLFGISVVRLGMSLAFTLIIGLGTVFGTLIPLVVLHRNELFSSKSEMLMVGCGLMVIGVVISGIAGKLREQGIALEEAEHSSHTAYLIGLGIAVLSGVLSSMLNLSLAFGEPMAQAAVHNGAAASSAAFAVWPVALAGGFIPNLAYTLWLLLKNRSWNLLAHGWQDDALLSLLMGLLWIGAVAIYGVSTRYLGPLGDSAGWAIYQITMVLTANVAGLMAGEWRAASRRSFAVLVCGVLVLVFATVTTAFSTR